MMEITVNLRISADASFTNLINSIMSGPGVIPKAGAPAKATKPEPVEDLVGGAPKVTVEELREVASALMIKNKAGLKAVLEKFKAKTVAALDESDYAEALADMKKASK